MVAQVILSPITWLWTSYYTVRRFAYSYGIFSQRFYRVPIISVGNLTFGGTGKTPFTLWLAREIEALGLKSMILMRGYRGRLEDRSGIISAGKKMGFNPLDFGDEALLLARRLNNSSIVVGKRRADNLEYYFDSERPDVIILDDGHQHLKLGRKINIVMFDCLLPFRKYTAPPLGYMREGFSGIKDADLIVLGRSDQVSEAKKESLKQLIQGHLKHTVPIVEVTYLPVGLFNTNYEQVSSPGELTGLKAICVAGLASPISFYNQVKSYGVEVIETVSFPDHHPYTQKDIAHLLAKAEQVDALVIVTEKDMVKLRRITDHPRLVYLEIQLEFLSGEQETREILSKAFL
jgi:tetraacyldisaccharide 4'-kinase